MPKTAPDVLMLLATGCAHCPGVLAGLAQLLEGGHIGRLEVINIVEHPQAAQAVGARSVPWVRIGHFELEGSQTPEELARWVALCDSDAGFAAYYSHLLETGRPYRVRALLEERPETLTLLVGLLGIEETPMAVRIGIGVVLEELAGSDLLGGGLDDLIALASSPQANTRGDAAHYLGLTHLADAAPPLQSLLEDPHPDVREIAAEALQTLADRQEKK